MSRAILFALSIFTLPICAAATPATGEPLRARSVAPGVVEDFNPTRPGLHDYAPPTPVGRGHGNAYLGAGYVEFLFSGGPTPRLPPRRVYVGPLENEPYGNRRMRRREGASSRSGVYMAIPEGEALAPLDPVPVFAAPQPIWEGADPEPAHSTREIVPFAGRHPPGTIVINSAERFLYLVQPDGRALRYAVGVGRDGFGWKGVKTVSGKRAWPDWRPPADMLARRPDLPRYMPGGPDNPLGARALYLGNTLYRIHGSNEPETIGAAVSSGCFRMNNEDVIDLYDRIPLGTKVVVL